MPGQAWCLGQLGVPVRAAWCQVWVRSSATEREREGQSTGTEPLRFQQAPYLHPSYRRGREAGSGEGINRRRSEDFCMGVGEAWR